MTTSCPKCGNSVWQNTTEDGVTMNKCQGCGKAWAEGCNHKKGYRYLTDSGQIMERCTICGRRKKVIVPPPIPTK
jgi:rRNA maturation protein Nop10